MSTSYTLWFLRYSPEKIFKLKVTTARSTAPTNVPTKFQLHTPYGFYKIQPGQTFSRPATHPDAMGENNYRTALKGYGVKILTMNKQN